MLCLAYASLAIQSSHGSIWDEKEKLHRRWVVPLLKVVLALGVFEVVIVITNMALLIDGLFLSCHKYENVKDAFIVDMDDIKNAFDTIDQVINGNKIISSPRVYRNVLELLFFQFSMLILYYAYVFSKTAKGRNLCCSLTSLCCICVPSSMKNPMAEVGELLSGLRSKDSLIKSDLIAGLTSLYATAKTKNVDERVQKGIKNYYLLSLFTYTLLA